jgi:cupin 2 domain-containing protein
MTSNLFAGLAPGQPAETVEALVDGSGVRIERIVSTGQTTAPGQWYDQERHEWVVVLRGRARLGFEGAREPVSLGPGDHVTIPAHCRHRVEWTDPAEPTVWLAVHYGPDPAREARAPRGD